MTKATRIINKYHIKEMLLNGNPQFENFYKEELISFCEIAKKIIQNQQQENQELKKQLEDEEEWRIKIAKENSQNTKECLSLIEKNKKHENQQKEFIEWLENKIKYWEEQEQQWINLGFMKVGGEANNKIIFKKALSKYKEIIGVSDESKRN